MNPRFTPAALLIGLALAGLSAVVVLLFFATHQPWLGMEFVAGQSNEVRLAAVRDGGPAHGAVGTGHVISVRGADGTSVAIDTDDLTEEPDTFPTYAGMNRFFTRQSEINTVLQQEHVVFYVVDQSGIHHRSEVSPAQQRPAGDLPAAFWVQLCVGLAAFLVGMWVWSLRPGDLATALFALASLGILGFTLPAALYSTRELALDGDLARALSIMNHGGALLFGATMIALLLHYPRPLVSSRTLFLPFVVFGLWWLGDSFQLFAGPPTGSHLAIMLEMIGILICAVLQYWRARGDPSARVIMRWFGLSVTVGAGAFVLTVIIPSMTGFAPLLQQGYAFSFFLLIHIGLALGVTRYRLFDLDRWAFRILFYMMAAMLLVLVDAALITWVAIERAPAFGLTLILVALLFLPLHDAIATWLSGRRKPANETWFQDMIELALSHSEQDQHQRWQALLTEVFQPLRISPGGNVPAPVLLSEGAALAIPAIGPLPAQRLEYAVQGRRLFSPRDQGRATELCAMLAHAMDSSRAHERGVTEERGRITRDMHDNIGIQLLGALHSRDVARKDDLIRDTLVDLREIINNSAGQGLTVDELMADLRIEMADLLSSAGLELVWDMEMDEQFPAQDIPVMRSILREAIGNALQHAKASSIRVAFRREGGSFVLTVEDDGIGFAPGSITPGNGLENMRARMAGLKGSVTIDAAAPGTRITAQCQRRSKIRPMGGVKPGHGLRAYETVGRA